MKEQILNMIAESIGIKSDELDVFADLECEYDVDSTEKADLARILEKKFQIKIEKSSKDSWNTAEDIVQFVINTLDC